MNFAALLSADIDLPYWAQSLLRVL
ncbi:MAG: hypothetical protein RJA15_983, partial [Actinomycetota bacterium]